MGCQTSMQAARQTSRAERTLLQPTSWQELSNKMPLACCDTSVHNRLTTTAFQLRLICALHSPCGGSIVVYGACPCMMQACLTARN